MNATTKYLILGATSAIAQQTCRILARAGGDFCLVGRNPERLAVVAADLRVRGAASARVIPADLGRTEEQGPLLEQGKGILGHFDIVLVAYGALPDPAGPDWDWRAAEKVIQTNFTSAVSLLLRLAAMMEQQRKGHLVVISSIAGDRGRRSNYLYGSTKAGLSVFLEGLRARLRPSGVHVLTVKPGLVDTPMTSHLQKNWLFSSPERVGRGIVRALRRDRRTVYVPGYWRLISWGLRALPGFVLDRLNF